MSTLILARHGRSTSNSAGTLAGRLPGITLDDTGEAQARALGERLRGVAVAAVVCSPLERCQSTAQIALATAAIDCEITTDERVIETHYGDWSGRLLKELADEPLWKVVQSSPSRATFPGGEAMIAVRDRMVAAVNDYNRQLPADAVWMIVSHGDPINGLLSWALGQPFDEVQRLMVDPASASVIHLPDPTADHPGKPRVGCINSVSGDLTAFARSRASTQSSVGGGVGATGEQPAESSPSPLD